VAGILLVLIGVISIGLWRHYVTDRNSVASAAANADNKQFQNLESITAQEQVLGHDDQAANLWISYSTTTPSKTHKETALLDAAALYMSNGQYSKAISMCKKSETVDGVTFDEAELAANAYFDLKDNQAAIHYYQEAIRLIPPTLADGAAEKTSFQQAIKELRARP
jgi:tetratricopeptide (TPR) repeat protein